MNFIVRLQSRGKEREGGVQMNFIVRLQSRGKEREGGGYTCNLWSIPQGP